MVSKTEKGIDSLLSIPDKTMEDSSAIHSQNNGFPEGRKGIRDQKYDALIQNILMTNKKVAAVYKSIGVYEYWKKDIQLPFTLLGKCNNLQLRPAATIAEDATYTGYWYIIYIYIYIYIGTKRQRRWRD